MQIVELNGDSTVPLSVKEKHAWKDSSYYIRIIRLGS
jgi:hypothetical protein